MTIYVVSAGRSGTGWLCSVLAGCGLKVQHEWTPFNVVDPDVVANTEWVWNQGMLLSSLTVNDVVIVIDRDREAREASVNKLLGKHDWSRLHEQWEKLKANVELSPAIKVPLSYGRLHTEESFTLLHGTLRIAERDTSNLRNMWDFMRHMKVTNNTVEQMVKESYGL